MRTQDRARMDFKFRRAQVDTLYVGRHRLFTSGLLAAWVALCSGGCGVFVGDPIELFAGDEDEGSASGPVSSEPCIEEATLVAGDTLTSVDVPARELAALLDSEREANLLWSAHTTTRVHVTLSEPKVYSVRSRINQRSRQRLTYDQCADYARIDARVVMKTDDGKLDETVENVSFIAYDAGEAQAVFAIEVAALRGSYKPRTLGTRCHLRTAFHLMAAYDGTHGAMIDEVLAVGCDQADKAQEVDLASGHWGPRWAH